MTENHSASSQVISSYPFWHISALIAVNFFLIINGKSEDITQRPLKSKNKIKECKFILELYNRQARWSAVYCSRVLLFASAVRLSNAENFKKPLLKADLESLRAWVRHNLHGWNFTEPHGNYTTANPRQEELARSLCARSLPVIPSPLPTGINFAFSEEWRRAAISPFFRHRCGRAAAARGTQGKEARMLGIRRSRARPGPFSTDRMLPWHPDTSLTTRQPSPTPLSFSQTAPKAPPFFH